MKTSLRIGLALLCLLFVGCVLLLASRRNMSLIAADQPPANARGLIDRQVVAIPRQIARGPNQILLHATVIDIDAKKLAEAGIDLSKFVGHSGEDSTSPQPGCSLVPRREAELLAKLIRTSRAGKILAEPTIVATDNRPASFHSGGEFPVIVPHREDAVAVEYRRFGTSLDFKPKKLADGKLRLEIRVEQAEIDHSKSVVAGETKVPGLKSHRIDTAIEMEAGQTAVLAELRGEQILVLITPEFLTPPDVAANQNRLPVRSVSVPVQPAPRPQQPAASAQTAVATPSPSPPRVEMTALLYMFDSASKEQVAEVREELKTAGSWDKAFADTGKPKSGKPSNRIASVLSRRVVVRLTRQLAETNGVHLLSRPKVSALTGQPARLEVKQKIQFAQPVDVQKASALAGDVGVSLDVKPTVQGDLVQLQTTAEHSWLAGDSIESVQLSAQADLYAGETMAVCQDTEEGKQLLFLVTPTVHDSGATTPVPGRTQPSAVQPTRAPRLTALSAPRTTQSTQAPPSYADAPQPGDLTAPPTRALPAKQIPRGMRVVSIRPSEGSNGLTPGDVVDVVSVVLRPEPRAKTLLRGIKVFAVDRGGSVSLLVTIADVEQLALQAEVGKILLIPGAEAATETAKSLARRAAEAAMQLEQLRSHLGPNHPDMAQLKARLEEYRSFAAGTHSGSASPLADFQQTISDAVPGAKVDARRLPTGILLNGSVADARQVGVILRIAEQYFPEVVNNMTVARVAQDQQAFPPMAARPQDPVGNELRDLREDVRLLRHDVKRLIEILEENDTPTLQPAPDGDQQSSAAGKSDGLVWRMLGIRVEEAEFKSDKYRGGLKVIEVRADSPAAEQGIRAGDILAGLDRWETLSRDNLSFVLGQVAGQESLRFYVLRGGKTLFGDARLESAQSDTSSDVPDDTKDTLQPKEQAAPAREVAQAEFKEIWRLTLDEVIAIALQNSKMLRALGGVAPVEFDSGRKVMISRVNREVSLPDFETTVQKLVKDTETTYWELWAAHRNLETAKQGKNRAQLLWNELASRHARDEAYGQAEAQAREQYFFFREQVETAMQELNSREAQLRGLVGLSASDGRLIRPADEPMVEEFEVDWEEATAKALLTNAQLRQQRSAVKQMELQLAAASNAAQPGLDIGAMYRWLGRKAGDSLEFKAPTGVRLEAAAVKNAQLKLAREKAILEEVERQAIESLSEAARDIDFRFQNAKTHSNRTAAAESEAESVAAHFKDGETTLDLLLDAQRRLAESRTAYTSAVAKYAIAVSVFQWKTGVLLTTHRMTLEKSEPPTNPSGEADVPAPGSAAIPDPTVELKPGDRLTVESLTDPTLNRHISVLDDGTVTLPLLGQVEAEGHTLPRFSEVLTQEYREFYKVPGLIVSFFETCAPLSEGGSELSIPATPPNASADLKAGDRLSLESLVDTTLNRRLTILGDGTLTLPWLGQVPAAGRTLTTLKQELEVRYREYFKEPSLTLSFLGTSLPIR